MPDSFESKIYSKTCVQIPKRNYLLLTIPNMIRVARHGEKEMFRETFGNYLYTNKHYELIRQYLLQTNVYKKRKPFDRIDEFLNPNIYHQTLINEYLLSPLHRNNRKYFIYHNRRVNSHIMELSFKPRVQNTQLVKGKAWIDTRTGRIIEYTFMGAYDMLLFEVDIKHGTEGYATILPKTCEAKFKFFYLGNKLLINSFSEFGLQEDIDEQLENNSDMTLMERVRPTPLSDVEYRMIYPSLAAQQEKAPQAVAEMQQQVAADTTVSPQIGRAHV